ncbi:hypothetical protein I4U23_010351 [Adineta vaga]|nr:hypothetical protein I4U23_010351 [Adineta vaga]
MSSMKLSSVSYMTDIQKLLQNQSENPLITLSSHSNSTKTALKYFNMRVTQRLHRYRSMKKQWQEVATSMQNSSLLSTVPPPDALIIMQDSKKNSMTSTIEIKGSCVSDCSNTTITTRDIRGRNSIDIDPLHSRIQQDLIKLRKLIKQNKSMSDENISYIPSNTIRPIGERTSIPTTFDDQENHIHNAISLSTSSLNKLKPLDRVKISGCQMRSSLLPKSDSTDSGVGSTSNSSSTCSQYSKQQQEQKSKRQINNKTFNICHSRVNLPPPHPSPPLPSDTSMLRASHLSKKKTNTSSKMTQNGRSKQTLPSRLSLLIPSVVNKKQPSFTKQEIRTSHMRRLSTSADMTTRLYTYAASSSSIIPQSMMLKRNTSLLPILLHSSSCMGLQTQEIHSRKLNYRLEDEQQQEKDHTNDDDDDYYHLLDYKHLINRLPKSIISIRPRYGQDDYGILFDQLAHIRERMPDSNAYDEYARTT